jgi:hypothetical protein
MRQQAARMVVQRNTGFITGGFDAQNKHKNDYPIKKNGADVRAMLTVP